VGAAARLLVVCVPAAACTVWTILAGKDVNWDLLNYHYYLPFELIAGRLDQDFFAASAQSYLNPIGYLPFYLMVSSGWHSVFASVALALAHSSSLALLYFLAWRLFTHLPPRERVVFSCIATVMGAATAVFWATVGGSFIDPLLVPPMLGGLLLLLDGGHSAVRRAALAGALFGAAAALKYSNGIFALAAFPLALAMPGLSGRSRLRACLGYIAGGALALGVLAGPWFTLMYREFGNPVFPLFNAWFQSPYAPPVNMASERFAPRDWIAALFLPFRMVVLDRALYSEMFAPDIRFAALAVAALALPATVAVRRTSTSGTLGGADWRSLFFLGAGITLWLATSANARYGMVVLLLAGVCLVRMVERLLPPGAARVALIVILAVQVGTSVLASPPRWFIAEPWSKRWLPYDVPERALREPALYLTLETLPMAVVAPFVHRASSFVNFRGQSSIPPDSPRLASLLERHRGRARALGRALELVNGKPRENDVKAYDDTLLRIGYRLDTGDCFTIAWQPDSDDPVSRAANWLSRTPPSNELLSVVSCALRPVARDAAQAEKERRFSALFDRMEQSCPEVFHGHTAVTEPLGSGWSRHYVGLDARLEAIGDRVILNRYRAGVRLDLGRLSDWEAQGVLPAACGGRAAERREP
jgi:hypothetical protein